MQYLLLVHCINGYTKAPHCYIFFWERGREAIPLYISNLYNILCTVNTQHTSRQDTIIKIRLYLSTSFGRNRPSSGQLRTILRYSKNSAQWDPISFTLKFNKIWKFLLMTKAVEQYGKMVKLNLHVLYSGLTMVHTIIVCYICQQQSGIRLSFLVGLNMAGYGRNM